MAATREPIIREKLGKTHRNNYEAGYTHENTVATQASMDPSVSMNRTLAAAAAILADTSRWSLSSSKS